MLPPIDQCANNQGPGVGDDESRNLGAAIRRGITVWLLFSIVSVFLRGIRWDDNLEYAQILLGWVDYPEGHPRLRYVHGVFSLQTYLSALVLWLTQSDAVLCAFRNILFLMATVVPVYLLGAVLSRRALGGHCAAALALLGAHVAFDNQYPLFIWPGLFSYGHIGLGLALITLAAFAAGRLRTALFLLGLLPAIHLGQLPVLIGTAGIAITLDWAARRRAGEAPANCTSKSMRTLLWLLPGFAICVGLKTYMNATDVIVPLDGPYVVAGNENAIWSTYTNHYDAHRMIMPGNQHLAVAIALLVSTLGFSTERRRNVAFGAWGHLWAYCLGVAILVWGTMAVHATLGNETPFILLSWMPYRLTNHSATLLHPMFAGLLLQRRDAAARNPGPYLLIASFALLLARPWLAYFLGESLYSRFLAQGEMVAFAMVGFVAAQWYEETCRRFGSRWFFRGSGVLLILALANVHQFGACCLVLGIVSYWLLRIVLARSRTIQSPFVAACIVAGCMLAVAEGLFSEWQRYEQLPRPAFDTKVAALLAERGESGEMLVTEPVAWYPQVRLRHPIFLDMDMISHVMYKPELGPAIIAMYRDMYGMRYDIPPSPGLTSWKDVWRDRSREAWVNVARHYQVRYVVSPSDITLQLDEVLADGDYRLYRVPVE